MTTMHFDHVEAGALGVYGRLRVVLAHAIHLGAGDLARHMHEFVERERRGGHNFPVSVGERMIHALPAAPRRALSTGMAELQAELRAALAMDEITDAFPGGDLRVGIDARATGRDPGLFGNRRHLSEHQPGAAYAEAPKMHEMEVAGYSAGLGR